MTNILKWSAYIKGSADRQDFLERALEWISKNSIDNYMALHRHDDNINDIKKYFNGVIEWVSTIFIDVEKEMCGLEWGRFYEQYHHQAYNSTHIQNRVQTLYGDAYIKNRKGIFEFILGGEIDIKLLDVRVFDEPTKKSIYKKQTDEAKIKNISNCPLCAIGNNTNKIKIWDLKDMDADHVTAWSKGGATDMSNCEMLCKTHNRAKGNR